MNGLIAWFAGNRVAANLLAGLVVAGGLLSLPAIQQEIFPEVAMGTITVSIAYPGAAPDEVETGICIPVEEAIHGIDGIRRIASTALEGLGTVAAELERGADARSVLDEMRTRVDALDGLPEEAETPQVRELFTWNRVIDVAVHGDVDEYALKALGERVRDDLLDLPDFGKVELTGVREDEISIEVSEDRLREHGLLFADLADAVRRSSIELPGGSLRTAGGEILLRAQGKALRAAEFERIALLTRPDGTRLRLGDVARVVDGFAETDQSARFDGEPAVLVHVLRSRDQKMTELAAAVKAYVASAGAWLPEGVRVTTWRDQTVQLESRRDLLVENGAMGLVLVLVVLALFLRAQLALWVSAGILISFLGAVAVMPLLGVTLNMMSSLAFLVALGLVTDDAIVVGERIERRRAGDADPLRAAIAGAREVAVPVVIAGLTTMVVLVPVMFLPGVAGSQTRPVPIVAVACLAFSLVESLLILPAHLAHRAHRPQRRGRHSWAAAWDGFQARFAAGFERLVHGAYAPALVWVLRWRWLCLSLGCVALVVTLTSVSGGWVRFTFMPHTEGNYVTAILTMPRGTAVQVTDRIARRIEASAERLRGELDAEYGPGVIRSVYTSLGEQPEKMGLHFFTPLAWSRFRGAHVAEVQLEMAPAETRRITGAEVARRWRALTGPIPDALELIFAVAFFSTGSPIDVQLAGADAAQLESAAETLQRRLAAIPGVRDIANSYRGGKRELVLHVRPEAEAYGLSLADLALQVRQAFHGEEAQRIQRGREEVRVMVRYPPDGRRSLGDVERMWIRTRDRDPVPFSAVARAEVRRGYAAIERSDRKRTVNVTADVDPGRANAGEVAALLEATILPEILADHPGVAYGFEGHQRDQGEFWAMIVRSLLIGLLAIYVLLALPLRSYAQPMIILLAVPFGIVGAVWGHVLLGMDVTGFSLVGVVGLSGVVVNDSLVLMHGLGALRREGLPLEEALRRACITRFRPIVITSLTTALGLLPLLLETSTQARWLQPIAVSLAFGELFATVIVLALVPAAILGVRDLFGGETAAPGAARPRPVPETGVSPLGATG